MTRQPMVLLVAALALATPAPAQDTAQLEQRSHSGPRIGLTYATGPAAQRKLAELGLDPVLSQFGWHFEQITRPRAGGGPSFVIEEVLLVGGVDQGTAIPSASMLLGIRLPSGWELGMGPNLSPTGAALALGIGKSLRYGAVTIPLNIAVVRSSAAFRYSFLFGYALETRRATGATPTRTR